MAQITYADKTALYQNADVAAENKVRDVDMNEIKQVVNDNETKILLDVTDTAPAECSTGDMYFDTTDNLIYTATATDTWGSTGVAPTENTIYVVLTTQTSYMYDGNTLVSVGGGSGSSELIMVDPDVATADTKLYIESTDLDGQYLPVDEDIYSTTETKTNKIWIDGKDIYRKVFTGNAGSVDTSFGTISNFDKITMLDGMCYVSASSQWFPISTQGGFTCQVRSGTVYVRTSLAGWEGQPVNLVVEYTKTS